MKCFPLPLAASTRARNRLHLPMVSATTSSFPGPPKSRPWLLSRSLRCPQQRLARYSPRNIRVLTWFVLSSLFLFLTLSLSLLVEKVDSVGELTDESLSPQTFNLQRIALLPVALGQSPPDPELIYLAMQDKLHQPYRQTLIPGLTEIVQSMTPGTQPGLLGVCLSGAGPTILALATENFSEIAERIISKFKENKIVCNWKVLEPAEGTTVTRA